MPQRSLDWQDGQDRQETLTPDPALLPLKTLHQHVADARGRFRDAGLSTKGAELDARLLAQHVLGWTAEEFIAALDEPGPSDFGPRYEAVVERRIGREPLAYIVGRQEFWGLSLEVSPAVLIPRPETELIVESALELFGPTDSRLAFADICTGSGCVAIALAKERPVAQVTATDISTVALDVARRNATRHGVADRIRFCCADLLEGLEGRPFDLIACNPPYVADGDRRGLQPEVRDFEPGVALFGGAEGVDLVDRLVRGAAIRLRPGGYLLFEFGFGQDERVEAIVGRTAGLSLIELRRDLQGIARTAIVQRL